MAATIWPGSASLPMWSFFQDRRDLLPCFSISHSPGPQSLRPVLPTNRCMGSAPVPASVLLLDRGRGASRVAARRLRGGVVRHEGIEAEQAHEGADQALGLAQR